MITNDASAGSTASIRSRLARATEPAIFFPAVALLFLGMIWGATLNLIEVEYAAAERAATVSSGEIAETYEAQVVRALREIDQTLKVVKYAFERNGGQHALQSLKERALLPPDLFFVVSIADRNGDVTASTRPSETAGIDKHDVFQTQLLSDILAIGKPYRSPGGEWTLHFSRGLNAADGTFAGVVLLKVDAAYFVSGYDTSKLGQHGMLGILGADGIFRARRSGDEVSAGNPFDHAVPTGSPDADGRAAAVTISASDGVRRYTSSHQLYDFPLSVIVGLSVDEQMAVTQAGKHRYLWWASAGSAILILVIVVLARLSTQLAQSRHDAVREGMAHARRVEQLAYHDGLTKLPNRSLFSKLLSQGILDARRSERQIAVLFLDLDRFKQINDTLGHVAGDRLLQEVASRLKDCLRQSDTVARLGGDEFVILLPEPHGEEYVAGVAQKVLSAVSRPYVLLGQEFRVTASIGISTYPQDGLDEQTLTKNADIAMYQAKEMGKNNFQLYSANLNANSLERLNLESGLRHALERGEFDVHYQPKRDMRSGCIAGLEALLRWQHPDLGTIAPMRFLPVAEETGLIVPIGKWVLRTVCMQYAQWQKVGLAPLIMAVNLSARQFADESLVADVLEILAATGMDGRQLELEIAESLLMQDVTRSLRTLGDIKASGVRIAIADFGVGYASLATLRRFPLDTIKIDRSCIRNVSSVGDDRSLTEAIIAMGRSLSLTVVAQGVETKEQADFLLNNACDELQGFYVNMPMPAPEILALLKAGMGEVWRLRHESNVRPSP